MAQGAAATYVLALGDLECSVIEGSVLRHA